MVICLKCSVEPEKVEPEKVPGTKFKRSPPLDAEGTRRQDDFSRLS
jgi:hypothetical protein